MNNSFPIPPRRITQMSLLTAGWLYCLCGPCWALTPPQFTDIKLNAKGGITVSWNGGGTLQFATRVLGKYLDVTGATSPYTFTPSKPMQFARIKNGRVLSINTVGYVNIALSSGFNLIQNPLNRGGNTVAEVLPVPRDGTMVYTYSPVTGFNVVSYDGEWLPAGTTVVAPGRGFFLRSAAPATVTFIGEVPLGTLNIPLVAGFNLVGSSVPQAGKLVTDLRYPVTHDTTIYKYSPSVGFTVYDYTALFGWTPAEPELAVGESFWSHQCAAGAWNRIFNVNNP